MDDKEGVPGRENSSAQGRSGRRKLHWEKLRGSGLSGGHGKTGGEAGPWVPVPLAVVQPVEWTGLADQFNLWGEKESQNALGFSNLRIRKERLFLFAGTDREVLSQCGGGGGLSVSDWMIQALGHLAFETPVGHAVDS